MNKIKNKPKNDYERLLNEAFLMLNVCGTNPKTFLRSKYSIVVNAFCIPANVAFVVFAVLGIVFKYEGIDTVSSFAEVILIEDQALICWISVLLYRKKFNEILENVKLFWDLNICGEEMEKKLQRNIKFIIRGIRLFRIMSTIALVLLFLKPLLTAPGLPKGLPAFSWTPQDFPFSTYMLFYSYQAFVYVSQYFQISGFDFLFVGIITILAAQFDLLKTAFQQLDIRECQSKEECKDVNKKMKNLIKYHDFLIKVSDDVGKVYGLLLLNQAGNTLIFTTMALFLGLVLSPDFINIYGSSVNIINLFQQLAIMCYYGQLLHEKSIAIGDGIYESGWHLRYDKKINSCVLMVIMCSQKAKTLTGIGLVLINWNLFLQVYRLAWSSFTLLSGLNNKGPKG